MKANNPLSEILRRRKLDDFDFDLLCFHNYISGQFGRKIPVDENREVWEHLKKLIIKQYKENIK